MAINPLDGPIPGANYTSDTKNYPWHRPPEITNLDKAIDEAGKKLLDPEVADGLLTMIEMGIPISSLVEMFVTSGIGAGKWTVDYAILMAGPVSHIMCLLADGYGIKYDLGIDTKVKKPTKAFFEAIKIDEQRLKGVSEDIDLEPVKEMATEMAPPKSGGFMGMGKAPEIEGEI